MTSTTGLRETLEPKALEAAIPAMAKHSRSPSTTQIKAGAADVIRAYLAALPGSGEQVSEALDAARELIDAFCNKALGTYPPATQRDKLATDILALSASMAGPVPEPSEVTVRRERSEWPDRQAPTPALPEAKPVAWVTPETLDDLLNDAPWAAGAIGELSQRKKDNYTVPLYAEAKPVASPAEGEAVALEKVADGLAFDIMAEHFNGQLTSEQIEAIRATMRRALPRRLRSPDREAATREAVIERELVEANQLLRSAYSIADREGSSTYWDGFRKTLKAALERQLPIVNAIGNLSAMPDWRVMFFWPDAKRRLWFLSDCLARNGKFNRDDLCSAFGISVPQASADIRAWMNAHPGAVEYDTSKKTYAVARALAQQAKPQQAKP